MAKTKKKKKNVKRAKSAYKNPARVSAKKSKPRRHNHRSRNPQVFGRTRPVEIAGMVGSLLLGVTVTKLVPPMFPASWTATNGMRFGTTAAVAIAAGVAAHALMPAPYRDAAILGALAQTASIGLNVALPSVSSKVNLGGGRGVGDFVRGRFPEPNNPIYRRIAAPSMSSQPQMAAAQASAGAMGRYKRAY